MAQKKITDLTLRSDFDETVNLPGHDATQTWRVTGQQILDFMKAELEPLLSVFAGKLQNVGLACSVGSNALTIALKTAAGNDPSASDPIKIGFRHATLTNGTQNIRTITAAQSLVISSGSTLGHASAAEHCLYVYLIDPGAPELAVSTALFDQGTIVSTTAEGGAGGADSNAVMYSTAARSNVPCRLIGRLITTQTTAGTWAAAPTETVVWPFETRRPVAVAKGDPASATNGNPIIAPTKDLDTHNAYNATTGRFTCPEPGIYEVTVSCGHATGNALSLYLYKGGVIDNQIVSKSASDIGCGGSTMKKCVTGDILDVRPNDTIDVNGISLTFKKVSD